ncbi:WD40-repeat-containing domain protein [Pelagophyceae sp. CCMP2097]|nr:WD40-repeat-containing domain protein [Pelagophyceae sp. CCMP2097]
MADGVHLASPVTQPVDRVSPVSPQRASPSRSPARQSPSSRSQTPRDGNDRFIPCRSSSRLSDGLDGGDRRSGGPADRDGLLRAGLLRRASPSVLRFSPDKAERRRHGDGDENADAPRAANGAYMSSPQCSPRHLGKVIAAAAQRRRISSAPFKVLGAPKLADDFYLDLVAWSATNVLAVGLGAKVYVWSACTSNVSELCDLGPEDAVASLAWTAHGSRLAVGSRSGRISLYDATRRDSPLATAVGHEGRVGCVAWNGNVLATGSRDRTICLRDARVDLSRATDTLRAHKLEVCGLKWSPDGAMLASGGNDNKLLVYSLARATGAAGPSYAAAPADAANADSLAEGASSHRRPAAVSGFSPSSAFERGSASPVCRFEDHTAAVKAIAWSPHERGLVASGGGAADRTLRFRDALTATATHTIDTGSQVCNLSWSRSVDELVSTHGFALNQICIWRSKPQMHKHATLLGHTTRVLYLATSPDDTTIVTGAGDETLRFWSCFPALTEVDRRRGSLLFPSASSIR